MSGLRLGEAAWCRVWAWGRGLGMGGQDSSEKSTTVGQGPGRGAARHTVQVGPRWDNRGTAKWQTETGFGAGVGGRWWEGRGVGLPWLTG